MSQEKSSLIQIAGPLGWWNTMASLGGRNDKFRPEFKVVGGGEMINIVVNKVTMIPFGFSFEGFIPGKVSHVSGNYFPEQQKGMINTNPRRLPEWKMEVIRTWPITEGPNKSDLLTSVFTGRECNWAIRDRGGLDLKKFHVHSLSQESGDGESWCFEACSPQGEVFRGYYETKTRKGTLNVGILE